MAYNKVILVGNLTKDVELKQTPTGVSVATFSVAVNRRYKDADGNQATDFINIVAWRKTAEFVAQYFKKGNPILIDGELQVRSYNDNNGNKRRGNALFKLWVNNKNGEANGADNKRLPAKCTDSLNVCRDFFNLFNRINAVGIAKT